MYILPTRFIVLLSVFMCTGFTLARSEQPARKRPNILFILIDDLRPALGCYGDPTAITPYMDRLAAKSIRFDRAYSNQAVCAPSRYNLMLGSRSTSTGIYDFGRHFRDFYPGAVTLPQYFMQHGYHAEAMGKVYHIGHNTYNDPASWSIPHHSELVIEYVEPGSTGGKFTREEALFANETWEAARALPRGAAWESPDVPDEAYADGRTAKRAVERLRELKNHPDQPFFLAVGFARPHLPFSVPLKYWNLYDPDKLPLPSRDDGPEGAPRYAVKRDGEIEQYSPLPRPSVSGPYPDTLKRKLIHGYYAGVSYVDAQIGKVLSGLEALGLDKNTIIVLWGDHGYHLGELGIWTKHVNYELANRIPLLVAVPGLTDTGSHTGQPAETVDIYPTLAELAGLPPPRTEQPLDGVSLVPVIRQPDTRVKDHAYHCFPRGGKLGRAIRTERYRLIEWKIIGAPPDSAEFELYDYRTGLIEEKSIAGSRPDILAELKERLYTHPEASAKRPESKPLGKSRQRD